MKLYHASLVLKVLLKYHQLFPDKKLNVLRTFADLNPEMMEFCKTHRNIIGSLILDSGTWTLNNTKTELKNKITLLNYISYLEMFEDYFDFYFNFDSDFIGTADETNYLNQVELEGHGFNPVPVVHDIEGDEINHYTDKGCEKYPIIALGSAQIKSVRTLDYVMSKFEGTGIKIHLFGHAKFDLITNFPLYSCDSTAWSHRGQYGFIHYWNPEKDVVNKTDKIYMEEYLEADKELKNTYSNYEYRNELDNYLYYTLGVTESDLLGPDGAFYKQLVNLHYYVQLEGIVNQIYRQQGFNTE
jgi:hypothetical protein